LRCGSLGLGTFGFADDAGSTSPAINASITSTNSNSTNVKPRCPRLRALCCFLNSIPKISCQVL